MPGTTLDDIFCINVKEFPTSLYTATVESDLEITTVLSEPAVKSTISTLEKVILTVVVLDARLYAVKDAGAVSLPLPAINATLPDIAIL